MNTFSHVPPGFRFHPTDEELVDYYLRKKIASKKIDLDVIRDVDLYKIEPWDLQELCKIGSEDQNEWYFFSHKDKKYPTGTRTNRATKAGFWKATGRDKAIYIRHNLVGMRKTLVFYKGRAPNGQKSDWIMHEYRLETNENGPPQEEGWVVCRVFKKRLATVRRMGDYESPCWYDQSSSFMPELDSPRTNMFPNPAYTTTSSSSSYHQQLYSNCKQELDHHLQYNAIPVPPHPDSFLQLPQLESPKVAQYGTYDHHLRNNGCHVMPSSTFRQIGEFLTNLLHHSSAMTSKKLQRKQQQITRMKQYLIPWVMKCIRVWEPTNPRGRKILLHRTMPPQHPPQVAKLIFGNET